MDPNKSSLSEKWLLVKGKIQHIHLLFLSQVPLPHRLQSSNTKWWLIHSGRENLKDCEIYSLSTVSLILTPKWIWNNHTKEKHFLTEKTNKQVLLRAVCDLANQWESKNTILSHSLWNHIYPGDSYPKRWLHQLFVWTQSLIFMSGRNCGWW